MFVIFLIPGNVVLELCLVLLTWNAIAASELRVRIAKLVHRVLLLYLAVIALH